MLCRRLLITGADGYIGARLSDWLRGRGFQVTGLDAGYYSSDQLYPAPEGNVLRRDVREVTPQDLAGFDAVVHLAELSNDPLGELDPEVTLDINHRGTLRLAHAAREAGVRRFVYFSSCSVYGETGGEVSTEESALKPLSQYARCKELNERALREMASGGFSPVLLRNATVYGPSPRMRFDLLPNNLAGLAHTRGRIELISDGSPRRPLIHIEDVCLASELVLRAAPEVVHNQVFNVGDDEANYSVLQIASQIARIYPGCPVELGPPSSDRRSYVVSFRKVRERLGFEPKWNLERGAAELQSVFSRVGLSLERFEAPAFTRLRQIRTLREQQRLDERLFWRAA